MEMTNSEIVRSYREAKDKGKQVKILSQLNLCEVGEILDILAKNGVKPQEMPRMRRAKVKTEVSEAPPPNVEPRSDSRGRCGTEAQRTDLPRCAAGLPATAGARSKRSRGGLPHQKAGVRPQTKRDQSAP